MHMFQTLDSLVSAGGYVTVGACLRTHQEVGALIPCAWVAETMQKDTCINTFLGKKWTWMEQIHPRMTLKSEYQTGGAIRFHE